MYTYIYIYIYIIRRPLAERLEQGPSTKQQKTQQQKTAQSFCNNLALGRGLPLPFLLPWAPKITKLGSTIALFCSQSALGNTPWKNNKKRFKMTAKCRPNGTKIDEKSVPERKGRPWEISIPLNANHGFWPLGRPGATQKATQNRT